MYQEFIQTPIGTLQLTATDTHLTGCYRVYEAGGNHPNSVTNLAKVQLNEYFAGNRKDFSVPLRPFGTEFQTAIWAKLVEIPFGQSATYGDIACQIGKPTGARAVGNGVGKNPILIFIPCHRILPKSGKLGGFSAGIDAKEILIALEKIPLQLSTNVI